MALDAGASALGAGALAAAGEGGTRSEAGVGAGAGAGSGAGAGANGGIAASDVGAVDGADGEHVVSAIISTAVDVLSTPSARDVG